MAKETRCISGSRITWYWLSHSLSIGQWHPTRWPKPQALPDSQCAFVVHGRCTLNTLVRFTLGIRNEGYFVWEGKKTHIWLGLRKSSDIWLGLCRKSAWLGSRSNCCHLCFNPWCQKVQLVHLTGCTTKAMEKSPFLMSWACRRCGTRLATANTSC